MCGIAGCWTPGGCNGPAAEAAVRDMALAVRHRGPDDMGTWCDGDAGIAFGHRRLSILDLSPLGHQPMLSANGRWVLAFNGEIYNCAELRTPLERAGVRFRGHSDTEVLVEGIARWGRVLTLQNSAGMFALAAWDREARTLHLARDRFGEKPLCCGRVGRTLLFGSELKALRTHPSWRGEIDRDALALYFRYNCVPAPHFIRVGVSKLLPGHVTTFRGRDAGMVAPYWPLADAVEADARAPLEGSEDELVDVLERQLRTTLREQMVAYVALGALLSGVMDSMAVTAHLGTAHTELYATPEEARAMIPRLPAIYDEPFAESSQMPTFLASELARRHVTVSPSAPSAIVSGVQEPRTLHDEARMRFPDRPLVERMMYTDALTYLPDDLMVKVDRAAMAVILETRAPFLDHRVGKLAWRLPLRTKVRDGEGKWALRQVAYRHVSRALLDRPKQGFGVPIDSWLRGPLRQWAGDLLSPERLKREGFLAAEPIVTKWTEHVAAGGTGSTTFGKC